MKAIDLNVSGNKVKTVDVTYRDLVWLYNDFIKRNGHAPTTAECLSKNNLPQGRIVKRILEETKITYNDFMLQFGKVSHVRTESNDYELFLNKFRDVCSFIGKTLTGNELNNNKFGLPNTGWFIKYCPDKSVKTYDDFVRWCGYSSNKLKKDADEVGIALVNLEHNLGRAIRKTDITSKKVGFSLIVVERIWGSLNKAKEELGLLKTPYNKPKSFAYYKKCLADILHRIKEVENRTCVSWKDIENDKYLGYHINHKTYIKAFRDANIDFNSYLKSIGFTMSIGGIGYSHTFDDGETVKSIFEYDFTRFLRNDLGLEHNKTYFRDVRYNQFADIGKKRINCDYVIEHDNQIFYIEIAGMIYNNAEDNWRSTNYASKRENDYRDKMIVKEDLLIQNSKSFLFLFPRDMMNDEYKAKTKLLLNIGENVA